MSHHYNKKKTYNNQHHNRYGNYYRDNYHDDNNYYQQHHQQNNNNYQNNYQNIYYNNYQNNQQVHHSQQQNHTYSYINYNQSNNQYSQPTNDNHSIIDPYYNNNIDYNEQRDDINDNNNNNNNDDNDDNGPDQWIEWNRDDNQLIPQHKHHDTKSDKSVTVEFDHRSKEETANIRDMNNWAKYVCITRNIRDAYASNDNQKIRILDLGCGSGSDLYKCRGNKKYIKYYLGIDVNNEYIFAGRKKYNTILLNCIKHRSASLQQRKRFGINNAYGQTAYEFYNGPMFNAQFICDDITSSSLCNHPLICNNKYNLINIQFALHYAFQTKYSLLSLLNTIKYSTKYGSLLICSIVRDDVIIKRFNDIYTKTNVSNSDIDGDIIFSNKFQSIKMKINDFENIKLLYDELNLLNYDINEIYDNDNDNNNNTNNIITDYSGLIGIPYKYYQMDSVDNVTEYFISFPFLCKILYKYCNMKLIHYHKINDIYIEYSRKIPYKYGYTKGRQLHTVRWSKDELDVTGTYGYAVFKRIE